MRSPRMQPAGRTAVAVQTQPFGASLFTLAQNIPSVAALPMHFASVLPVRHTARRRAQMAWFVGAAFQPCALAVYVGEAYHRAFARCAHAGHASRQRACDFLQRLRLVSRRDPASPMCLDVDQPRQPTRNVPLVAVVRRLSVLASPSIAQRPLPGSWLLREMGRPQRQLNGTVIPQFDHPVVLLVRDRKLDADVLKAPPFDRLAR